MKHTELMIGDWVMVKWRRNDDVKDYPIMVYSGNIGDIVVENLIVEPIPLTPEILEKNGCKKWTWYKHKANDVTTYAIGDGFQLEMRDSGFVLVDNCNEDGDYGYEANWITECNTVHKLQHLLKDLEIEKEIVL